MAMPGDIIAEQNDDIGLQRIGAFDDTLDALQRHPGIAGVQIGNGGDLQSEPGGPLRGRKIVARDLQPQQRLAKTIGRAGNADRAEAGG